MSGRRSALARLALGAALLLGLFAQPAQVSSEALVRGASTACQRRGARATSSARSSRATRARAPRRPAVTEAYVRMRTAWHQAAPRAVRRRWMERERPPLVLRPVSNGRSFELTPSDGGTFEDRDVLAIARDAFRYRADGESADVHPRLLDVVYRAVRHFEVPFVHVVSGFRTTRSTSRHNQGRAVDIVLPGVPDERLAAFLRQQGFVGVGVYPTSGFVHVDVRARSFFWTDRSGPNQSSRVRPAHTGLVARYDASARQRDELAVPDLVVGEGESEGGE